MSNNSLTLVKTLYYRLNQRDASTLSNASTIDFIPYLGTQTSYSGVQHRFMMDENKVRNTDVIGFIGYRTPETSLGDHSLCSLYNETINIQTLSGYVSASAIYNDNGNGFMSEQPFIEYAISAASGEFNGSKILTIFFDNVKKTRVVKIFS